MESKFIYAKTKAAFQRELPNIPEGLDPIVFIEDTQQVWVMGKYFSIGSPGIFISEEDSSVKVEIGNSDFKLSSSGDSLTIRKGTDNEIIFSSAALNSIDTNFPLKWGEDTKKLTHEESGVTSSNYGEPTSSDNVSIFTIPYFTVDKWGHVTKAENKAIQIRDYVEQLPSDNLKGKRNILLANSVDASAETNVARKAGGLTYDPETKEFKTEGGISAGGDSRIEGDLEVVGGQIIGNVKGDITGTATPKIHLSDKPEYGGASKHLYGHVRLQDELTVPPPSSSDNVDASASTVENGVAASPKMVWDTKKELENKIDDLPIIDKVVVNDEEILTDDLNGVFAVRTVGGISAGINPETKEVTLKTPIISGYDEKIGYVEARNKLEFTKDFEFEGDKLSIRWTEIH